MKNYPEKMDLDAIKQAIEERDEAVQQYHDLAQSMVYHGNSVAHWYGKAKAYRDAIGKVWNELLAAGIACDGNKSCADGVRELAARKAPSIQPQPEPVPVRPTEQDVAELAENVEFMQLPQDESTRSSFLLEFTLRVLTRWGTPTIQPVPVSERLPGPEDCDRYGQCWFWCKAVKTWDFRSRNRQMVHDTHWLPAHALPVPEDCEENKG
jgi:hypothetical protein